SVFAIDDREVFIAGKSQREWFDGAAKPGNRELFEIAHVCGLVDMLRWSAARQSSAVNEPSASLRRIFRASGLESRRSRTSLSVIIAASSSEAECIRQRVPCSCAGGKTLHKTG